MSQSQSSSSYSAALKQRLLRAREQRQSPSTRRSLFDSPFVTGGVAREAIPSSSLTQEGEELIWVRDPDR